MVLHRHRVNERLQCHTYSNKYCGLLRHSFSSVKLVVHFRLYLKWSFVDWLISLGLTLYLSRRGSQIQIFCHQLISAAVSKTKILSGFDLAIAYSVSVSCSAALEILIRCYTHTN